MAGESEQDRHRFARRLEAFSDIVFGFALAQSAFSLEVPKSIDGVYAKSSDLILFAVTFAVIGAFWMMHYRVFHYAFAGERIDVVLNFVLLAAIAMLPYVLRLYLQFPQSVLASAAYAGELGVGFSMLAGLEYRGLRLLGPAMAPKPRLIVRRALLRHTIVGAVFLCSLPVIVLFGLVGRFFWGVVLVAMIVIRIMERTQGRQTAA